MHRFWALSLRRQLFIAIVLLLVPVLGAAAWSGVATYRERLDELGDEARVLALTTAAAIEREFTGYDRMARNVGANLALQKLDPVLAAQVLEPQARARASLIDIVVIDRSGGVVARGANAAEIDGSWSDRVAPIFAGRDRVMSALHTTHSGHPYVTLAYPVIDPSRGVIAAIVCYVDPQRFEEAFESLRLPGNTAVVVTDSGGRVLVHSIEPAKYVGQFAETGQLSNAQPRDPLVRQDSDGLARMYGEARVDAGPWLVAVGIPTTVARDRAMLLWSRSFAILVLGVGSWLLVALVFSRRLTESLAHLDTAAKRIASGDFTPIERQPMPTREFAELQAAFDQMLRAFNDTKRALDTQMTEERRMRQQLQSLQRQVIRQERLAAVGQLVSGVAHEINNPLQAILGFAELLQMQADVPDTVKSDLILIQKESARACGIIRNLAMFARQQTGDAAPVRLADVIQSVAELRQRRLETEDIELRIEDGSAQHVLAVLTELQQVVLNFVVNAEQAIVTSGRLPGRITIRTRDDDERVILEVEDTGPGIPPENEKNLFQPFFTTKPVGQGTGLGLSVSYGIIDSLGGHIGYRSAPAGGAIFYFDLPAASVDVA
jgi:C4-dicarboxylate-specific signal transduction histidine kinase